MGNLFGHYEESNMADPKAAPANRPCLNVTVPGVHAKETLSTSSSSSSSASSSESEISELDEWSKRERVEAWVADVVRAKEATSARKESWRTDAAQRPATPASRPGTAASRPRLGEDVERREAMAARKAELRLGGPVRPETPGAQSRVSCNLQDAERTGNAADDTPVLAIQEKSIAANCKPRNTERPVRRSDRAKPAAATGPERTPADDADKAERRRNEPGRRERPKEVKALKDDRVYVVRAHREAQRAEALARNHDGDRLRGVEEAAWEAADIEEITEAEYRRRMAKEAGGATGRRDEGEGRRLEAGQRTPLRAGTASESLTARTEAGSKNIRARGVRKNSAAAKKPLLESPRRSEPILQASSPKEASPRLGTRPTPSTGGATPRHKDATPRPGDVIKEATPRPGDVNAPGERMEFVVHEPAKLMNRDNRPMGDCIPDRRDVAVREARTMRR